MKNFLCWCNTSSPKLPNCNFLNLFQLEFKRIYFIIYLLGALTRNCARQSMNSLNLVFQNPGMLKGVMQKVNPFKSTSQVDPTLSACCSRNVAMVVMCQTMRASRLLRFSHRSLKLHLQSRWRRDEPPTPVRWVKDDGVLNVPRHDYKPASTHSPLPFLLEL